MTRGLSHIRVVAFAACAGFALAPAGLFAWRFDSSTSSQASDRKFNVGVLRADGVLTPFAQFDRGTWRPFWTGLNRSAGLITVPLTLDDVDKDWWRREPPSLDWMLWRPDGRLPLRVHAPRVVPTPCGTQVALATDFKPDGALPPFDETPYPKEGIATTAPVAIEPILPVERESADWQRVKRGLEEREFAAAETRALREMQWSHPVSSGLRDRAPIDLQAVWHVPDSRFFYFEAMRRYPDPNPPKGKPPCELVTYVAGYLWEERPGHLRPVNVGSLITYCHMERAMFLWPFGVVRDQGKQYWIFQSAGWSGESYGVVEPVSAKGTVRPHLWYVAGRCR